MDSESESLLELATSIKRLKMHPYFDISHYIFMCILIREDSYPSPFTGTQGFSRIHPLSCWFGSMMLCFAGGILGNFVLGEPLLLPFKSESDVIIATVIWYLINYSPCDFMYRICKFTPVKLFLSILHEMMRANKVHNGILFALKNFSGSYILVCLFGVLKGSAALHMRIFQRLVCGSWLPTSMEILKPSAVTKATLVASIAFILLHNGYIEMAEALVYFSIVLLFCLVRLLWMIFNIDPFIIFESVICSIFFGGLVDAIKRATEKKKIEDINATTTTKNSHGNKTKDE